MADINKPGYRTSEFWLHLLAGVGIASLQAFNPSEAGLPPLAQGAYALIAPVVLAWLAKNYASHRAELKTTVAELKAEGVAGVLK